MEKSLTTLGGHWAGSLRGVSCDCDARAQAMHDWAAAHVQCCSLLRGAPSALLLLLLLLLLATTTYMPTRRRLH